MIRLGRISIRRLSGVAKGRKDASFRKRKLPFAKGRFWLRKEDFFFFFFAFQCPFEVN